MPVADKTNVETRATHIDRNDVGQAESAADIESRIGGAGRTGTKQMDGSARAILGRFE